MKIKRALISVSDKTGLEAFVKGLAALGVEIISTGGTAKAISGWGVPVRDISSFTGYPEMLDGRVKTLHPKVHGGLLALRGNSDHMRQVSEHKIELIDMVVVNLYPFEATVSRPGVTEEEAIENIDIGGPSMLRSASKNFSSVAVVSSPNQYEAVLKEMQGGSGLSGVTLRKLAVEAYGLTSRYDAMITRYLSGESEGTVASGADLPETLTMAFRKVMPLRYGENPHQRAAFYRDARGEAMGIAAARQLQGKELSFNNMMDLSSALGIVREFDGPAACVVKHNNPCGAAMADTLEQAFLDALDCDRMSAFGGIFGFNRVVTKAMAEVVVKEADFIECMIARGYDKGAIEVLSSKKNLRVMELPSFDWDRTGEKDIKKVAGGLLVEDVDLKDAEPANIKVVTAKKPSDAAMGALLFAWKVVKHVKSNAIVLAQGTKTVGIGAGQMSRVDSVIIAIRKAGENAKGAVLASDAFFPKPDSIEEAHKAGVSAMIQPGGSIKDQEVIAACDKFGIPMVFTGMRHFRH